MQSSCLSLSQRWDDRRVFPRQAMTKSLFSICVTGHSLMSGFATLDQEADHLGISEPSSPSGTFWLGICSSQALSRRVSMWKLSLELPAHTCVPSVMFCRQTPESGRKGLEKNWIKVHLETGTKVRNSGNSRVDSATGPPRWCHSGRRGRSLTRSPMGGLAGPCGWGHAALRHCARRPPQVALR